MLTLTLTLTRGVAAAWLRAGVRAEGSEVAYVD